MTMTMRAKVWLVTATERMCDLTHHVGGCRLARWSHTLDERWATGQWTSSPEDVWASDDARDIT